MKPIKVLEIQGSVGPGGSERHTLILSKGLKRSDDFDVAIIGPYFRNPEMFQEVRSLGIPCYEIDLEHKTKFVRSLKSIIGVIRDQEIDVIHTHLRNADIYGIVAGMLAIIPVIATLHGRTGSLEGRSTFKSKFMKLLHSQLLRYGTKRILAISNFVKEFNVKDLSLDPSKIEVIYNCTETDRFDITLDVSAFRKDLGVQSRDKVVSLIGGISRQKGAHHFVEVASIVARRQGNIKFLIAGFGDFEDEMRKRVRTKGLSSCFIFAGWRSDVPKLLHATDILVMAAHQEGFGRIITEAMAASKPVVAFASGGVPEIVVHGETGYLVPYGDIEGMASYVLELLQDEAACKALGHNGRQRLEKHFSPTVLVQRTKKVLESVIG